MFDNGLADMDGGILESGDGPWIRVNVRGFGSDKPLIVNGDIRKNPPRKLIITTLTYP